LNAWNLHLGNGEVLPVPNFASLEFNFIEPFYARFWCDCSFQLHTDSVRVNEVGQVSPPFCSLQRRNSFFWNPLTIK
jgi:hypothetical protein